VPPAAALLRGDGVHGVHRTRPPVLWRYARLDPPPAGRCGGIPPPLHRQPARPLARTCGPNPVAPLVTVATTGHSPERQRAAERESQTGPRAAAPSGTSSPCPVPLPRTPRPSRC